MALDPKAERVPAEPNGAAEGVRSAEGPGAGPPAELPEEALAEARQEAAHYRDRWMRSVAELENFKKWMYREREEWNAKRTTEIMEDLLRVRDDFERALSHSPPGPHAAAGSDAVMDGFRLVYRHLVDLCERHGVVPIDAKGQPFDPELHDAVLQVDRDDMPPQTVVDVALPGYRLGDRVLRHAQVVVSRRSEGGAGTGVNG